MKGHLFYELHYKSFEFSSPLALEDSSIKNHEISPSLSNDLHSLKSSLSTIMNSLCSLNSAISKSDKVLNSVLCKLVTELTEFNSLIKDILEEYGEACGSHISNFLSNALSSKKLDLCRYDYSIIPNSVLYLPKEFSLFYMAIVDTVSEFSGYIYGIRGGDWNTRNKGRFYVQEHSYGKALLNSNMKMI